MQPINDNKAELSETINFWQGALSVRIQEHALIFEFNLIFISPKTATFHL